MNDKVFSLDEYKKKNIKEFAESIIDDLCQELSEDKAAYFVQDHNHYFLGLAHGLDQAIKIIEKKLVEENA